MAARVYVDSVDISSAQVCEEWMDKSACLNSDPELFFPVRGKSHTAKSAKTICKTQCSVQYKCLAFAMMHERKDDLRRHGIFGGLDEKERRALQKQLNALEEQEKEKDNGNDED